MNSPILAPVVALAAWSMIMWIWMYAKRLPALLAIPADKRAVMGQRTAELGKVMPPASQWPADNYNHLMEQPTLFYAVAVCLALLGVGAGAAVWLAWAYAGLRVVHSLVQATTNIVILRFALFTLSSLVLIGLIALAAEKAF
jgi:hypothetical protein